MSLWCQIDYNGEILNEWVAGSAAQPALPLYESQPMWVWMVAGVKRN